MKETIITVAMIIIASTLPVGLYLLYKSAKRLAIVWLINSFSKRERVALIVMQSIILGVYRDKHPKSPEAAVRVAKELADCFIKEFEKE